MIIKYGNTDITDLLLEYRRKGSIGDKAFLLGNAPSYELDLKLDNTSKILETLSGNIKVYEDSVLKGTYILYEAPERYTDVVTLTCFDNMVLTNIPYSSTLEYPTTINEQLNEISKLTALTISKKDIPSSVLNRSINFFDNTISCRDCLSWIAEICGMNVMCNEKGELTFRKLSVTFDYETEDVSDYSVDDSFTISRVCYDNGLLKLESGTDTNNTLYLSSNNPYIDSSYDPTPYILNLYKNLSFKSLEKMKAAALDDIQLFDIIQYNGHKHICLNFTSTYYGGDFQVQDIDGKLKSKNAEKTTIRYSDDIKLKMIKVALDQNSGKLDIISREQEGQADRLSKLELDNKKFKVTVEEQTDTMLKSAKTIKVEYAQNDSPEIAPVDGWSVNAPVWNEDKYIWTRNTVLLNDGTSSTSSPVCITGAKGSQGPQGKNGADGTSVTVSSITYQKGTSPTIAPNGSWSSLPVNVPEGQYLWTKTTFSNGSIAYAVAKQGQTGPQGNTGPKGENGKIGQGIDSITAEYYLSQSKTEQIGGNWESIPPQWEHGKYIWTRSKIVYKNPVETAYTVPVCSSEWEAANDVQQNVDNVQADTDNANNKADINKEQIERNEASISVIANNIQNLVKGANNESLMTQTEDGWIFDMSSTMDQIEETDKQSSKNTDDINRLNDAQTKVENSIKDISKKTAYIQIGQDTQGRPTLTLGSLDSQFKVVQTNESLDFYDGNQKVAYVQHNKLYISEAEITNKLRIGKGDGYVFKKRQNGNVGLRWESVHSTTNHSKGDEY